MRFMATRSFAGDISVQKFCVHKSNRGRSSSIPLINGFCPWIPLLQYKNRSCYISQSLRSYRLDLDSFNSSFILYSLPILGRLLFGNYKVSPPICVNTNKNDEKGKIIQKSRQQQKLRKSKMTVKATKIHGHEPTKKEKKQPRHQCENRRRTRRSLCKMPYIRPISNSHKHFDSHVSAFYYEVDIVLHLLETIPQYKFGRLQAAKFSSGKSFRDHATHLTPAEKRFFAFFN